MKQVIKKNTWSVKKDILTLYYAFKNPGTPWYARITAISSILYLLSPADFVPDLIPLAGYIDDIVVVPFLMNISTRLLPGPVRIASEEKARRNSRRLNWILALIVLLVVALMVGLFMLLT